MELIREAKLEKSKEMKMENRLIKENIIILKSKLINQNRQLNKLIQHEKKLSRSSIERNKEEKRHMFKELRYQELEKEKSGIELKENELVYWKNQYEKLLFS